MFSILIFPSLTVESIQLFGIFSCNSISFIFEIVWEVRRTIEFLPAAAAATLCKKCVCGGRWQFLWSLYARKKKLFETFNWTHQQFHYIHRPNINKHIVKNKASRASEKITFCIVLVFIIIMLLQFFLG